MADAGSVLELRRHFGLGMVTALIRIEGRPVGVVANNATHLSGAVDSPGADKAARFMQLCDAFDIPLLFLCDTPGMMVGPEVEKTALVRHCCRMFVVGANVTVPFFTIVLRKAYGLGAQTMGGGSFKAPVFTIAWPTGEFGGMGLEGEVKLGFRKELAAVEDPLERKALYEDMVANAYERGKALNTASHFELDEVIDPADTRHWVTRGLLSVPSPAPRTHNRRLSENRESTAKAVEAGQTLRKSSLNSWAIRLELTQVLPRFPTFSDDDRYIPGLRRVFDVIREQGSVPGVQIIHPGRQTTSKITGRQTVSASAIPCPVTGETPKELAAAEIEELEDAFARATRRAVEAGAEVIEFHAAHGYLLFQFLSLLSNFRQDRYGGSLENRARFALNAVDKARDLVGMNPVLGFRISAEEFVEGGVTIAESRAVARMMAEHSSDFIHVSAGTPAAGPRRFEEMEAGTYVRLAEAIKEVVDVPVICVGWVMGLDRAEAILAQGSADLVSIGRALVADHDLLKKCYADQAADVVECTHCGVCLESLYANEPMRCAQNLDL